MYFKYFRYNLVQSTTVPIILREWRKAMVRDQKIMRAVSRVLQRSERQEDMQKLLGTFVDVGVLPQLDNQNHQIFYGRRGTGKTHVFKVLDAQLREDENNVVVYIDARTLGIQLNTQTLQFLYDSAV
jgi:Cdc6-like AAA superfamily ATPase